MELRTDYSDIKFAENGKLKLLIIVGTRPEIIRLAAVINKTRKYFDVILAHTGQNYDYNLNGIFFHDLKLKEPEVYMDVVGDDLGATCGNIINASYKLMVATKPDAVLVLGDTNSCLSVIGAKRLHIQNYNKQNVIKITKEQYVTYISKIINSVINNGYNVEIFCNGNISDYEFARTIYSGYETDQNVQLATRPVTSMDLISLVSRFDYTIASRLHALIISYAFGIPFYGLSWDLKIPSFCSMIGYQNNYLDLHELNVSKVMNVFTTKYNEVLRLELKEVIIKEIKRITE